MNQNLLNVFNDKTEIGIVGAVGIVESCLIIPSKIGETASESDGFYFAIAKSKHFADNSKFGRKTSNLFWSLGRPVRTPFGCSTAGVEGNRRRL